MRKFDHFLCLLSFLMAFFFQEQPLRASVQQVPDSVSRTAVSELPPIVLEDSLMVDSLEQDTVLSLVQKLDSVIASSLPIGAQVSVYAYDLTDQSAIYEHNADLLCRPASTMKVLTAITALDQDRNSKPFVTRVYHDGTLSGGILDGNLWVLGGFDPEFMDEDMDDLVAKLASSGIKQIKGHIYGDVSLKDSLYWGHGWMWDDTPDAFQPYLTTLMFNKDKVSVTVRPSSAGKKATVSVKPVSSYYSVDNQTLTSTRSKGPFKLTRNWLSSGNMIQLDGNVSSRRVGELNLFATERFFMQTFIDRLKEAGVQNEGSYILSFEETSYSDKKLLSQVQTSFQEVLQEMLKESDNLNAEAMLWRIGYNATQKAGVSAQDGLKVVEALIRKLGLDPKSYNLADGCGLSMYDYISSRLLVAFLTYAFQDSEIFSRFYKALPVSGVDGTLKNRMKSPLMLQRVKAKTGSYTGINTLSGYLMSESGHYVAFAIMVQNVLQGKDARNLQDALCETLAKGL